MWGRRCIHALVRETWLEGLKVCIGGCLHTLCLWKAQSCRKETGVMPARVARAPFVCAESGNYSMCVGIELNRIVWPDHLYEWKSKLFLASSWRKMGAEETCTKLKMSTDDLARFGENLNWTRGNSDPGLVLWWCVCVCVGGGCIHLSSCGHRQVHSSHSTRHHIHPVFLVESDTQHRATYQWWCQSTDPLSSAPASIDTSNTDCKN